MCSQSFNLEITVLLFEIPNKGDKDEAKQNKFFTFENKRNLNSSLDSAAIWVGVKSSRGEASGRKRLTGGGKGFLI